MLALKTAPALRGGVLVTLIAFGATLLLCACAEKSKKLSKADREAASQIVLTAPPKPQHPLDVRFENKIKLLGYDLSGPRIGEATPFTVTWYWEVLEPLDEGWQMFTHLADSTRTSRINLDSVRALRQLHPEGTWKKGQLLKDVQEFTLPSDWNSDAAIFFLGFYKGQHRLHITVGPHDNENRAEVLRVPVASGPPSPELPRIIARRLTAPINLDGVLDEPDWRGAQPTAAFVQTMTGASGAFIAFARVAYDEKNLYVGYEVTDDFLKSTFKRPDDHLWEQDCVELMIDPDGDGRNYFEIQVAPTGLVFDTRYESRRRPLPFGEISWSSGTRAKVKLDGTIDDKDGDKGYTVELAVPWSGLGGSLASTPSPSAGNVWRMNFFVMDARERSQRAVGWSAPMIGDFHTLDRFGRVVFPEAALPPDPAAAETTKEAEPANPAPAPEKAPKAQAKPPATPPATKTEAPK